MPHLEPSNVLTSQSIASSFGGVNNFSQIIQQSSNSNLNRNASFSVSPRLNMSHVASEPLYTGL